MEDDVWRVLGAISKTPASSSCIIQKTPAFTPSCIIHKTPAISLSSHTRRVRGSIACSTVARSLLSLRCGVLLPAFASLTFCVCVCVCICGCIYVQYICGCIYVGVYMWVYIITVYIWHGVCCGGTAPLFFTRVLSSTNIRHIPVWLQIQPQMLEP